MGNASPNTLRNTSASQRGRIITRYGAEVVLEDETGQLRRCTTRRKLDNVACGDIVSWQASPQGNDVITDILPRKNQLTRPDARGRLKTIATNIDQVVIVTAYSPTPNWEMLDRYLVAASTLPATTFIVLNKADLQTGNEATHQTITDIIQSYRKIGHQLLITSTKTADGMDEFRALLRDKTSVLVGQSGVGKSSLIKSLIPDLEIRTQAVSHASGEGQHTTTSTTLYHLPTGGDLIDSPGVRDFQLTEQSQAAIAQGFIEFQPFIDKCRFHNCSHQHEPGCAVKTAVEEHKIHPRRLHSYQNMLEKLATQNSS